MDVHTYVTVGHLFRWLGKYDFLNVVEQDTTTSYTNAKLTPSDGG